MIQTEDLVSDKKPVRHYCEFCNSMTGIEIAQYKFCPNAHIRIRRTGKHTVVQPISHPAPKGTYPRKVYKNMNHQLCDSKGKVK